MDRRLMRRRLASPAGDPCGAGRPEAGERSQPLSSFLERTFVSMQCFFHLVSDDETILDDKGIEVRDLASAKFEAVKAISELLSEDEEAGMDWTGWRLVVVSAAEQTLFSFDLGEVAATLSAPAPLRRALHS